MSENSMWAAWRPSLVQAALDPIRVENRVGPGTPDVNLTLGWVELKEVREWPVKGGPLAVDHFTKQQRVWLTRRWRADRRAWMMLKVGDEWLLIDGDVAARVVGHAGRDVLIAKARRVWKGIPNVKEFTQCLTS